MKQLDYFDSNYEFISSHLSLQEGTKVYIGNKNDKVCRYCKKSESDVKFKMVAHAIPEFTGNKSLVAYDECDTCNEIFSRVIENHLANYLGAHRTLAQIHGKKGVPKYKSKNRKSEIALEESGLQITASIDDPVFEIDEEQKHVKITAHRQPYIPAAVFKCLVKMAIAIAPESILSELNHLSQWVLLESHTYESLPYKPFIVFEQFTPGPRPYPGVSLFLMKRKDPGNNVPYLQFVIAFSNTMFQIVLPMPEQDKHLMGKPISLTLFPVPFDKDYKYGNSSVRELDMSSFDIIKNEEQVLYMGYESIEKSDTLNKSKHSEL